MAAHPGGVEDDWMIRKIDTRLKQPGKFGCF
jgi:hypothetical protein